MASMQCYKTTQETCSPVNYPSMANPGQTQCYGQSQTYYTDYGMEKTQTIQCYTTQASTPTGYGSGLGMGLTYGMGSTQGAPGYSHGPSHGHGHGYGHGLTHNNTSTGYGHGHGLVSSTQGMNQTTHGSNGMACYGKANKKGHHYHRNRDGHCSDSCSDSDSDNEGCGRRMYSQHC